jgi:hypothetical protein
MAEPQYFEVPAFFPKSYQSDTRYHFEEHQADAIIRVATHQERYYQHQATTRFKATEQKAITSSIAKPFTPSSTADNGTLDCLPLSLFQDIVLLCDMSKASTGPFPRKSHVKCCLQNQPDRLLQVADYTILQLLRVRCFIRQFADVETSLPWLPQRCPRGPLPG